MKVTYTGKVEPRYPAQTEKLNARFAKLAKLLDGKGEKSSHVILANKRGVHRAEITVNYLDHTLVAAEANSDQFLAITGAMDKLEKQVQKVRAKRRDVKKGPKEVWNKEAATEAANKQPEPRAATNGTGRVFRVNHKADRKPMTLEEATLELGKPGDYVVYRDAQKDCLSVLVRRPDGNFDLIEG